MGHCSPALRVARSGVVGRLRIMGMPWPLRLWAWSEIHKHRNPIHTLLRGQTVRAIFFFISHFLFSKLNTLMDYFSKMVSRHKHRLGLSCDWFPLYFMYYVIMVVLRIVRVEIFFCKSQILILQLLLFYVKLWMLHER